MTAQEAHELRGLIVTVFLILAMFYFWWKGEMH